MEGSCSWGSKSSHKVRPNCITFSACINACPWTIAMHLFDQMRSNSIQPNAVTLNTVRSLHDFRCADHHGLCTSWIVQRRS